MYVASHLVIHPVSSKDSTALIKDQLGILTCWAEHLSKLLNCNNSINPLLLIHYLSYQSFPTLTKALLHSKKSVKQRSQEHGSWTRLHPKLKSYSIAVITCCTDFISFSLEFGHPVTSLNSGRMPKS